MRAPIFVSFNFCYQIPVTYSNHLSTVVTIIAAMNEEAAISVKEAPK